MADYSDIVQTLDTVTQMINNYVTPYVAADMDSRKSYKNNKKLMNHQYDLQKEVFDYTNQYNSPINQRFLNSEAGINPNMDGNFIPGTLGSEGIASGSQSNQLGAAQLASQNAIAKGQLEVAKQNADIQQQQVNQQGFVASSEIKKNEAEEQRLMSETRKLDLENEASEYKNTQLPLRNEAEIQNIIEEGNRLRKVTEQLELQNKRQELENNYYIQDIEAKIYEATSNGDYAKARAMTEDVLRNPQKYKLNAEIAKLWAEQKSIIVGISQRWYELKTGRMQVNEQIRHNLATEKLASDELAIKKDFNDAIVKKMNAETGKIKVDTYIAEIKEKVDTFLWKEGYWQVSYDTAFETRRRVQLECEKLEKENDWLDDADARYWTDRILNFVPSRSSDNSGNNNSYTPQSSTFNYSWP